jgi:hypothetical protein
LRRAKEGETGFDSLTVNDNVIASGLQRVRPGIVVRTKPYEPSPASMLER